MKLEDVQLLRHFIGPAQINAMLYGTRGEEGAFFRQKITATAALILAMPKTYEQEGNGSAAIVHLHYFKGDMDWFITEKDAETPDEPGQHQAFGLADLGYGGELGYISIVELVRAGVELDLYWKPRPLAEIQAKQAA